MALMPEWKLESTCRRERATVVPATVSEIMFTFGLRNQLWDRSGSERADSADHISVEDIGVMTCKGYVYSEYAVVQKASVDRMYEAYSCVCLSG